MPVLAPDGHTVPGLWADARLVNSDNLNNVNRVIEGKEIGTLFLAHKRKDFDFKKYLLERPYFQKG